MKSLSVIFTIISCSLIIGSCNVQTEEDKMINSLIGKMTLEEKTDLN